MPQTLLDWRERLRILRGLPLAIVCRQKSEILMLHLTPQLDMSQ